MSDPGGQLHGVLSFRRDLETKKDLLFGTFDTVSAFEHSIEQLLAQWVRNHEAGRTIQISEPAIVEIGTQQEHAAGHNSDSSGPILKAQRLAAKQRAFVEEYLVDLNATQAAIRAGYSAATACEIGSELLAKPAVAAAVAAGMAQRSHRTNLKQDSVLYEMSLLALSSISHYVIDDVSGEVRMAPGAPIGAIHAIQSIKRRTFVSTDANGNERRTYEVELKLWDKPTPLTLLGRHVGLFSNESPKLGAFALALSAARLMVFRVSGASPTTTCAPLAFERYGCWSRLIGAATPRPSFSDLWCRWTNKVREARRGLEAPHQAQPSCGDA